MADETMLSFWELQISTEHTGVLLTEFLMIETSQDFVSCYSVNHVSGSRLWIMSLDLYMLWQYKLDKNFDLTFEENRSLISSMTAKIWLKMLMKSLVDHFQSTEFSIWYWQTLLFYNHFFWITIEQLGLKSAWKPEVVVNRIDILHSLSVPMPPPTACWQCWAQAQSSINSVSTSIK